jgi:methylated-DNA-protein-cysteine methyltransferase-like protein
MKTFSERVVEAAMLIPKGRVSTYGAIAKACGGGGQAARSITAILAKAYEAGNNKIPFHRIVYAGGKVWLDNKYKAKRLELYKKEKIEIDTNGKIKNFEKVLFEFR